MMPLLPDSGAAPGSHIERLERLFWAAIHMPSHERESFLSSECSRDPDLRREVERMLAADHRAGPFLERPLPDVLVQDLPCASLARWQLLERVGEGGLGVVYRAERLDDGVRLEAAVKILRPGFDSGKFRERFVQERQILAGLDHPGIVRLMDCGADSTGRSFLVMEFVRGKPLDAYLQRITPPVPRRLELFESVCEAVGYLHSRLVVHGDIKPSNVLVTASGHPKLLDFGASSLLEDGASVRGEVTRLMLTPQYASPERKRGEGPSVSSDIFSLGRLLNEMLPSAAPSDLRYILERALAEDTADRYLSVADLMEDLRRLREGLPLRARPATAAYVARRFLRRNWAVATLTALFVVLLAGGWWRAERASIRASAAAKEALRQREAALAYKRKAREEETRASESAREAVLNAGRLDALVGDLIDDAAADPNILGQQEAAIESSLRCAAATLETLPGPPRWREISITWRRIAMILVHRGEFSAAEGAIGTASKAASHWLRVLPSPESRRNDLLVKLCELRLERQRSGGQSGYRLAHEALAEFRSLPDAMKAELNGSVWLETARLAIVREQIDLDRLETVPSLLMEVVFNSHARGLTQTRNLAVANLIWSFRRLNRLADARHWCDVAREWQVAESRIGQFCAEPLTAFTAEYELFPVAPGALPEEELQALRSRINQLILDRHEDPQSFPLSIALGRAYARLAEHYLATGQIDLARPAIREAAAFRNLLIASDSKSPVILKFRGRVDALEKGMPKP
jgi:serine/threonine protein kinase